MVFFPSWKTTANHDASLGTPLMDDQWNKASTISPLRIIGRRRGIALPFEAPSRYLQAGHESSPESQRAQWFQSPTPPFDPYRREEGIHSRPGVNQICQSPASVRSKTFAELVLQNVCDVFAAVRSPSPMFAHQSGQQDPPRSNEETPKCVLSHGLGHPFDARSLPLRREARSHGRLRLEAGRSRRETQGEKEKNESHKVNK